jgi:hypothetical protein
LAYGWRCIVCVIPPDRPADRLQVVNACPDEPIHVTDE